MFALRPISKSAPDRAVRDVERAPRLRSHEILAILLVWAVSVGLALLVEPDHGQGSTTERLYYSVYNVAMGVFVGFHLFSRLTKDGLAAFAMQASTAILLGTLANEAIVEPVVFGAQPINAVGVYYGLTDSLWTAGLFFLIRLADWLRRHRQPDNPDGSGARPAGSGPAAATPCLFVRVAGGTRRIETAAILYMEAQRDFTRVVCANGEYFVSESLKSLLDRTGGFGLVRVHKSFAVNLGRVQHLTRTEVELGGRRVPVGRRYWPAFAESWRARSAPVAAS